MLIGQYTHKIDEKRRLSLPSKFRKEIGKKIVLTRGLDKSLFVYTPAEWKRITEKLSNLSVGNPDSRSFNRFMLSGASQIDVDSLGRILIPEHLALFAELEDEVSVIGVHTRLEIWNTSRWQSYQEKISGKADDLAEKLGEIGMM